MNGYKHAGFLLLTLIFSLWIKPYYETNSKSETIFDSLSDYLISFFKEPEKLLNVLLTISLLLSVRFSYQESKKDIRYSYSNAKEMANFIISHKLDDKKYSISAHSADKGKTVLYYLQNQKQFYYPGLDSYGSHMWWNKKMGIGEKCSLETAFLRTKEKFIDKENILFLSDKPLKESSSGYELLYYTKSRNEFVKDEEFFLYELLRSEKAQ
jgi:hypothetical protein